jgi:hypothetical protein
MRTFVTFALLLCICGAALAGNLAPKKSVKEVMKSAMAGDSSLIKKVLSGESSVDEQKKLLDLMIDLSENDAPKGEASEWKSLTEKALIASAKVIAGREGSLDELKAATNCKACHDKFKGK